MTVNLFDVNVLLALFDQDNINRPAVADFMRLNTDALWATCAITENGFVRVASQPSYPGALRVEDAVERLRQARRSSKHVFWPCDWSLGEPDAVDLDHLLGNRQVTDAYLLGLAVKHGGCLITFDKRISSRTVPGATDAHLVTLWNRSDSP
jgi:toxin-antitoxin system PIN domain toxin